MVEGYGDTHIVIYTPPSHFDAAVILRTLYAGLGVDVKWKVYIVGLGKRVRLKLVSDSRVPAKVLVERLEMKEPNYKNAACVFVVDPKGEPIWNIGFKPDFIVLDYTSTSFDESKVGSKCVRRVRSLGLPVLTYEAIGVIYASLIRPLYISRTRIYDVHYVDARKAVYIARKFAEAMKSFDNYLLFEPNTIVYVLRRVYTEEGLLIDPEEYKVDIDPVKGIVKETIIMNAYNRRLNFKGNVIVEITTNKITISDWRGLRYKLYLDRLRKLVCLNKEACISPLHKEFSPGSSTFFTIS
jgi:hypothetical protein